MVTWILRHPHASSRRIACNSENPLVNFRSIVLFAEEKRQF